MYGRIRVSRRVQFKTKTIDAIIFKYKKRLNHLSVAHVVSYNCCLQLLLIFQLPCSIRLLDLKEHPLLKCVSQ
jgi:hypothetical protein